MSTPPNTVSTPERRLCWALLALGLGYAAWGFWDESVTRAVVMMDFTSMASNIRQSIAQQTIKPIWDDAESNAIPAAVMIEAILLTQYVAYLAGRARFLPQVLLWRSVMLHGLLVTHIGFYRLGRDRRFLKLSDNWFWTATILIFMAVVASAYYVEARRRTSDNNL
jgi:hypothetical protein